LLVLWYGLQRGEWMPGLLSSIALGMAMLPEEFPLALSVFLALGAWRLARIKVLARRPAVIEALGAATVLCVDKTGTLTENRMQLRRLVTALADATVAEGTPLPDTVHALLAQALLASRRGGSDPMDKALVDSADAALAGTPHLHPAWQLAREYPLTPELLAMSQAWADEAGHHLMATKGAPEAVFDLCHLSPDDRATWLAKVGLLAGQGLRVLAVAIGEAADGAVPASQREAKFELLGLVGFDDPLRPSVAAAVAQARGAGIAVAMITGDHAATALAIAGQAGIDGAPGALTGELIASLDDAALAQS
ncbi:MAG: ATPase, partial [Burkholderiales bacterium PBB5]